MATRILLSLVPKVAGNVSGLRSSVSILWQMGFSNKAFPPLQIHGTLPHNHCLSTHRLITEQLNNIKKGCSNTKAQWLQHLHRRTSILRPSSWSVVSQKCEVCAHPKAILYQGSVLSSMAGGIQVTKKILSDYCSTLKWYLQAFYSKLSLCKNLEEFLRTELCTWGKFCPC